MAFQVMGSHWHSYSSGEKGSTDVGSLTLVKNMVVVYFGVVQDITYLKLDLFSFHADAAA